MRVEPPNPKAERRYLGPRGRHGSLVERDANVIPLIDVVFILILYFMLAGSLDQELIEALTPPTSRSLLAPPNKVPFVIVRKDGQVTYQQQVRDDASLALALHAGGHPPERVALQADAEADAARVADIIGIIGRAGVGDVALITLPKSGKR